MYVYIYTYIHIYMIYILIYIYMCYYMLGVYIHSISYKQSIVYINIHTYTHVCMYACMYVCMYVCITHTHWETVQWYQASISWCTGSAHTARSSSHHIILRRGTGALRKKVLFLCLHSNGYSSHSAAKTKHLEFEMLRFCSRVSDVCFARRTRVHSLFGGPSSPLPSLRVPFRLLLGSSRLKMLFLVIWSPIWVPIWGLLGAWPLKVAA